MHSYFIEHFRDDQYGRQTQLLKACARKDASPGFPDCEGCGSSAIRVTAEKKVRIKEFRALFSDAVFRDGVATVRGVTLAYGNWC